MEEGSNIIALISNLREQEAVLISEAIVNSSAENADDPLKCKPDPLIQVIQKLSKIVESEKSQKCVLIGKKRLYPDTTNLPELPSKALELPALGTINIEDYYTMDSPPLSKKKVLCYQCSLCKSVSPTLALLKEHIKQHGQQNEVVLMCSMCSFTTRSVEDFESHVRSHPENNSKIHTTLKEPHCTTGLSSTVLPEPVEKITIGTDQGTSPPQVPEKGRRKWYTYEQYGMYRCLICSYTCGQQRMLKTHAWKHAGEVNCSYPIFEEEKEQATLPDSATLDTVVLSLENNEQGLSNNQPVQLRICSPEPVAFKTEEPVKEESALSQAAALSPADKFLEEPRSHEDLDQDHSGADSLLSSAQKIINCSPNKKGHVNVIVERLPSAREPVLQNEAMDNVLHYSVDAAPEHPPAGRDVSGDIYHMDKNSIEIEEVIIGWSSAEKAEDNLNPSRAKTANENAPAARRRTNSESLRLHSLAAEALVTMPIRAAELARSSFRAFADVNPLSSEAGPRLPEGSYLGHSKRLASLKTEELSSLNQEEQAFVELQKDKPEISEGPIKMGISMSLLTVIEKLKERTDQNASDEDILKELQDNVQCQPSGDASVLGSSLVEYIPDADRPFRCRLCHYSSGNKGYIKQHLRVHRQRQPYQCPICEHVADHSKDLESHMINHCKTRMYQCKQCEDSFHYKSQLRSHEREQHSLPDTCATPTFDGALVACSEADERVGDKISIQKLYRCDICDYTSTTYVGVRNHRRIHNSDKPYRCRVCDFATTSMNSLKCHMRRHPQEHQAVQLMEQFKCSLCGYVCSHPPSLKSHMWKHASDENYNYEQVNKAINDAISQSSRLLGQLPGKKVTKTLDDDASSSEGLSFSTSPKPMENKIMGSDNHQDPASTTNTSSSSEKAPGQSHLGSEYCVLLFCCCICGFESTSKENLLDHMKEHEGEIINIILNKDQAAAQGIN
ncbi:zinc finger protein 507 [Crotalus tigris]|uniref:zinc finger protein 507 n=1 Tax=Crotalus tigris TaxID=88082 RepID=UPI00192F56EF|nr:zinc finger protein 507 [Crotalus tigris]XP_039183456.1 zinc finger protein 507 [Crotalus tigris]XP_039183457.1 zinc finger protein 507 [Crotalus tigris]